MSWKWKVQMTIVRLCCMFQIYAFKVSILLRDMTFSLKHILADGVRVSGIVPRVCWVLVNSYSIIYIMLLHVVLCCVIYYRMGSKLRQDSHGIHCSQVRWLFHPDKFESIASAHWKYRWSNSSNIKKAKLFTFKKSIKTNPQVKPLQLTALEVKHQLQLFISDDEVCGQRLSVLNDQNFMGLKPLANQLFSASASSASSEGLFSHARFIVWSNHARLSKMNVPELVFLAQILATCNLSNHSNNR